MLPLLVETPAGFLAIAESDVLDWAGMSITGTGGSAVKMTLDRRADGYPSPLLVLSDSPKNYQGQKGIDFLRDIPTVWDESVVVSDEVGKSIVVARRAGGRWYLAAMNGDAAAELSAPLSFLSAGAGSLRAFADQPDGSDAQAVIQSTRPVMPSTALRLSLAPGGGFAGIISETKPGAETSSSWQIH